MVNIDTTKTEAIGNIKYFICRCIPNKNRDGVRIELMTCVMTNFSTLKQRVKTSTPEIMKVKIKNIETYIICSSGNTFLNKKKFGLRK